MVYNFQSASAKDFLRKRSKTVFYCVFLFCFLKIPGGFSIGEGLLIGGQDKMFSPFTSADACAIVFCDQVGVRPGWTLRRVDSAVVTKIDAIHGLQPPVELEFQRRWADVVPGFWSKIYHGCNNCIMIINRF